MLLTGPFGTGSSTPRFGKCPIDAAWHSEDEFMTVRTYEPPLSAMLVVVQMKGAVNRSRGHDCRLSAPPPTANFALFFVFDESDLPSLPLFIAVDPSFQ